MSPASQLLRSIASRKAVAKPAVLAGEVIATDVARRVLTRVLRRCENSQQTLEEVLYETGYQEDLRLSGSEPGPRTREDRTFLHWLRHELPRADEAKLRDLTHTVIARYTEEISGFFDPRVYGFATRILPPALGALLHGGRPSPNLFDVQDRILLEGDTHALCALARRGTLILAPTHVSNLDALVLGYAIYALGLPPFAYGAGLNLFTHAVTGFFMRHLGAFTVDRKKTDPLYRETLKEYATLLLEAGQNLLFFPGGTRSRAGAIESRLKLGFLGTAITSFGHLQARGVGRPVFIVPCTLSYPLVLEASTLVSEYLRTEGGPHYVELPDEFERPARWFDFLHGLAELDLRVHVRFGQALDILGNPVDARGVSRDPAGHAIDPTRYLLVDEDVVQDDARDAEYTRMLAERLIRAYRRDAVALPSHVLAFVVFERLRRRFPQFDIFRLLRAVGTSTSVPLDELRADLEGLLSTLRRLSDDGAITLCPEVQAGDVRRVLEQGIRTLSTYHRKPVLTRQGGELWVGDPTLLFYYRNRLDSYGLLKSPPSRALCTLKGRSQPS
jgi:glycerol-3-phosphate O-acyltransferase